MKDGEGFRDDKFLDFFDGFSDVKVVNTVPATSVPQHVDAVDVTVNDGHLRVR